MRTHQYMKDIKLTIMKGAKKSWRRWISFASQHIHSNHLLQILGAAKRVGPILHALVGAAHIVLIGQSQAWRGGVVGPIPPQPIQACMVVHEAWSQQEELDIRVAHRMAGSIC